MSEFDDVTPARTATSTDLSSASPRTRRAPDVVLAAAAVAVVATAFLPWLIIRIPGRSSSTFSLIELTGGRFLTGLAASICVVGIALQWRFPVLSRTLLVVGASLVGWLAGIGLLALGLIRGLLPSLSVVGIDLSRSLLGSTYGLLLAFAGVNLIGLRLATRDHADKRLESRLSLFVMAISLLLFALHQSVWLIADIGDSTTGLVVTGDSLFGSLPFSLSVWAALVLSALGFFRGRQVFTRLAAVALLAASLIKLLQTIVVWSGRGLLKLLLPSRVESSINLDLRWTIYVSVVLAFLGVVLGIFAIATGDRPIGRATLPHLMPSLIGIHATAVLLFVAVAFFATSTTVPTTESSTTLNTSTSVAAISPETTAASNPPTTLVPNLVVPTDALLGAVVNITLGPPGNECSGGSGVIVGDGTYVLTNEHVVVGDVGDPSFCEQIYVGITTTPTQAPSQVLKAEIVVADRTRDLALLRLLGVSPGVLPTLSPRFELLPIDAAVRVIGYPGVGGSTVTQTRGQVAGYLDEVGGQMYKVDVVINRGNSGGPMVDESGRLVGIATQVTGNDVDCSQGECFSVGGNLGLVRTIGAAKDLLERAGRS
jgi:S1-C subfamily serine protease